MAWLRLQVLNSFASMTLCDAAWPRSKTHAKLSLIQTRDTAERRSAKKRCFRPIAQCSVRRVSKHGSPNPRHRFPMRRDPRNAPEQSNDAHQAKGWFMRFTRAVLALTCLLCGTLLAQEA